MVKQRTVKLLDGRNLLLQVLSSRVLRLAPLNPEEEEINEKGELIGISYGEEYSVRVGECVEFDKRKYKINGIVRSDKVNESGYHLVVHSLTKSSQLVLPFLGKGRHFYRWNKNFCNCFIGREETGDYGSSIYLLYQWDGSKAFTEFEEALKNHPWYAGREEPDKYHTMYEFCIPDDQSDLQKIIQGQYSHISDSSKERILKFHGANTDSKLSKILNRDDGLRRALERKYEIVVPEGCEVFSSFYIEEEMYLNKYKIQDVTRTESAENPGQEVW